MISDVVNIVSRLFSINMAVRRSAHHEIFVFLARKFGFRLYEKDLSWAESEVITRLLNDFPGYKGKYVHERRFNIYNLAKAVRDIEGDTAECGVFHGLGSHLIIHAQNSDRVSNKKHHVFDSFSGLSAIQKGIDDDTPEQTKVWHEHALAVPLEIVQRNLSAHDNVNYYPGWIPDRFDEVAENIFSFVHIDVDLYQPTLDAIKFFFPRLVSGGILVCDDYGSTLCPGAKAAVDQYCQQEGLNLAELTTGQALLIKV